MSLWALNQKRSTESPKQTHCPIDPLIEIPDEAAIPVHGELGYPQLNLVQFSPSVIDS